MTLAKAIVKNTGAILIGRVFMALITFIISVTLAKYLGVEKFGIYSFIISYIGLSMIFTNLGINQIIIRKLSRNREETENLLGNGLSLTFLLCILVIAGSISLAGLLGYTEIVVLGITIFSINIVFLSLERILRTTLVANLKMIYFSIAKMIQRSVALVLVLFIVFLQKDITEVIIANVMSEFVGFIALILITSKIAKFKPKIDFGVWKSLLSEGWPFSLTLIFMTLFFNINLFMLSIMSTQQSLGYYSVAFRLIEAPLMLLAAISTTLFPVVSKYSENEKRVKRVINLVKRIALIVTIPMAIGTTLLSTEIITLVFGKTYSPAAGTLSILIWSVIFIYLTNLFASFLNGINKEKTVIKIIIGGIITNIILNLVLIEMMGYIGAAFATLITLILLFIALFICVKDYIEIKMQIVGLLKIIISSCIMSAFIVMTDFNILVKIPISVLLYFGMLFLIKGFNENEISLIRSMIRI